jgi:DNA polymerase-3 subunit delta
MKEIPETTCMILVQEKADKRVRLYKAIQKYGRVVELKKPDDGMLQRWLLAKIKQAGLSIRRSALESFMGRGYADMQTMNTELEKLISYCLDKGEVGAEDVEAVCSVKAEDKVYEMIDDIIHGKRKEAFERYYDLLALREHPIRILSIIGQQYLRLLIIKSLKSEGLSVDEIASKIGIREFAVKKSLSNVGRYDKRELERILERCAFYENSVKSGKLIDVMSTELLITELINGSI